jgi:hypothetical protein
MAAPLQHLAAPSGCGVSLTLRGQGLGAAAVAELAVVRMLGGRLGPPPPVRAGRDAEGAAERAPEGSLVRIAGSACYLAD